MNHAPIFAALAFSALGLSSTTANADVGFFVAPGTLAVTVGAPVVYGPPPPVVYAPPLTVVSTQPMLQTVVYRDVRPVSHRNVVVYAPVSARGCDHHAHDRDWRGPPGHAHGHHKQKHQDKHHGRGHGRR